jgi:lysozyme
MTQDELKLWIKKCEGFRNKVYFDSNGNFTIGYGRNLESNGISTDEAEYLFSHDFDQTQLILNDFDWYVMQPINVKCALFNMCFNLGISGLLKFEKMINALRAKDYTLASVLALNSIWAQQVGDRAKDIALMIREGGNNAARTNFTS